MEQRSAEWFAARLGCVTASRVKDVMASGRGGAPSATRKNYMMELLCERLTGQQSGPDLSNKPAVQRGVELEPFACMAYEADKGLMVVETGLVMHPSIPGFGASPDGLVGDDGV
ncbi:exonuclease, partial [Arthrobacter stackebrandtii]